MGVINLTPDSFSDGGRLSGVEDAVSLARRLVAEGAQVLDVGGESTRPGAAPVSVADELARVMSALSAIRAAVDVPLSIDTMKPAVARAAVAAGAGLWNDVTALRFEPTSAEVAAELGCEVVLMHMRGEPATMQAAPATMQAAPAYDDVVGEVIGFLAQRADAALAAGVERHRIWLDPGIGFGKSLAHNLALIAQIDQIVALGFPVLLGVSRKGFIQAIDRADTEPRERLGGSLAAALAGASAGVAMIRAHDVRQTVQALAVAGAIEAAARG
jgi:dihydropteroate synthase